MARVGRHASLVAAIAQVIDGVVIEETSVVTGLSFKTICEKIAAINGVEKMRMITGYGVHFRFGSKSYFTVTTPDRPRWTKGKRVIGVYTATA